MQSLSGKNLHRKIKHKSHQHFITQVLAVWVSSSYLLHGRGGDENTLQAMPFIIRLLSLEYTSKIETLENQIVDISGNRSKKVPFFN